MKVLAPIVTFIFLNNLSMLSARAATETLTACGEITKSDTTYILQNDIQAGGTCLTINSKKNVTIDLNEHTITYETAGSGVPNFGFELAGANASIPADWDISAAPTAKRVSTGSNAVSERWYLKLINPGQNQTIVSGWAELAASSRSVAYYVKDNADFVNYLPIKFEVEHETGGVIAAAFGNTPPQLEFNSSGIAGRYRLRLTYVHESPASWNANTEYRIGQFVKPTADNGAIYQLISIGTVSSALSASTEPLWNAQLGARTQDGNVTWITSVIGTSASASAWQANKAYSIGSYVRSSSNDGRIYSVYSLRVPGSVSGTSEPTWTPPPANVNTVDGQYKWKIFPRSDVDLDLVDLRPTGNYGIHFTDYASGASNVIIKNGKIRQGRGGGFRSDGVLVYRPNTYVLVEDLDVATIGIEAGGIVAPYGSGVNIVGNFVKTDGIFKFNRHQLSAAVNVGNSTKAVIRDNIVYSGEGWGGIYAGGNSDHLIRNNRVFTKSVVTNHYGIIATGNNNLVSANFVEADPGQGLRIDGDSNVLENNEVIIKSVAPNWDIDRYSLDGIRCNDYGNGSNKNQIVRNNTITVYGKNSAHFDRAAQIVVGITNYSTGPGNIYEGNVIHALKVDPEVVVSGLMPGSLANQVLWRNNAIESDQYGMLFGHYAGTSTNTRFENTRFIRGANAGANYVILGSQNGLNGSVQNTSFFNSKIEGGGTLRTMRLGFYANNPNTHTITWPVSVAVKDESNNPVVNTPVTIINALGATVFSGNTNASGRIPAIELPEVEVTSRNPTPHWMYKEYGPYVVQALIGNRTISKTFVLDAASEVFVSGGAVDNVSPSAPPRLTVN